MIQIYVLGQVKHVSAILLYEQEQLSTAFAELKVTLLPWLSTLFIRVLLVEYTLLVPMEELLIHLKGKL